MTRQTHFTPRFVDLMPPTLEEGVLYISTEYSLMAHRCASGCGEKVVLPLHPKQWRFSYDGQAVSVYPSVGNIGMPCNSHYWITAGEVEWSVEISEKQALLRHQRDRRDLRASERAEQAPTAQPTEKPASPWDRVTQFFRRRK